jgi:hypothetical protein
MPPEYDLFAVVRGTVTAPAGCGKTHLIADTLALHAGPKPILILTHTNAGVGALRTRLQRERVPHSAYRVTTIDGFAMGLVGTFPLRSGLDPKVLKLDSPTTDYEAIRVAACLLLQAGHLTDILAASYSRLIVDEYQDCSLSQHGIVDWLATCLATCVLGDPMQAIFNFGGNQLVDWNANVLARFPSVGELDTPWRWRNVNTEPLGHWLLATRQILAAGGSIDLRMAPPEVTWIRLLGGTADAQRIEAARFQSPIRDGTVLVIGDSKNTTGRRQMASKTPGAINVEPADLRDLTDFGKRFDATAPGSVARLVHFAGELMTNVGAVELQRRVVSLQKGTARNAANPGEHAVLAFANAPSLVTALNALQQIRELPGVRVYRPDVLRSCLAAMQSAADGSCTFHEATEKERERCRHLGRSVARRSVGSTLLLKGLEADVAVVLHPERMDAKHLYVALTRGARRVVICSQSPILVPER